MTPPQDFRVRIEPLCSVNGLAFGASEEAIVAWGPPRRVKEKEVPHSSLPGMKERELAFEAIRVRFRENRFVEASLLPEVVEIGGTTVSRRQLPEFLRSQDPDYREHLGFGIAPNLGLAYDLEHGDNITAFEKGRWDE